MPRARDFLPWNVVVVYNDMHAVLRAAQLIEQFGRKYGRRLHQKIRPAPVSYLGDAGYFERLLFEAQTADLIVVSFSGTGELPGMLKRWIEQCAAQKQGGHATVVALLGSSDQAEPMNSARYQFMREAARNGGLDFFAPAVVGEDEEEVYDEPVLRQWEGVG